MTKLTLNTATITVDFQPYGKETLGGLSIGAARGADGNDHPCLHGTVIDGSETSRLFQHTKTRNTAGERRTVYGIKQAELDRGHIVRVAM